MFYCNNEMGKKFAVLDVLFASREENIYTIKKAEREKMKELIKDNDSYEKLIEFLEMATDDKDIKERLKNSLDSYIDGIHIVGAYENEKSYKTGFSDAINLIIECIEN